MLPLICLFLLGNRTFNDRFGLTDKKFDMVCGFFYHFLQRETEDDTISWKDVITIVVKCFDIGHCMGVMFGLVDVCTMQVIAFCLSIIVLWHDLMMQMTSDNMHGLSLSCDEAVFCWLIHC